MGRKETIQTKKQKRGVASVFFCLYRISYVFKEKKTLNRRYGLLQIWSFCAGPKPSCGGFFAHTCIEKLAFVDYLRTAQKIH